ncbi:MAG: hypothetical protein DLM65_06535 [Candidatus Aeolococcus gillhamiae]|uniref:Uncharacterized protein n=1 Tax=Candidatus Aeolococcus gillhamiae TaxID=3127015 RepID=A0A2W5Z721_9BACT|nr:MAG: hypothetical protein DLM65_06535 [Candidatus Dormibacter sp. RRmetagenome_bin12]
MDRIIRQGGDQLSTVGAGSALAASPVAPRGAESFVMKMPTTGANPGVHTVCWNLDLAANFRRPPTCATVRVTT